MEKTIRKHQEENPNTELTLKDLMMDQIEAHLQKKPLQPGSELYTYAYQRSAWNNSINSKVTINVLDVLANIQRKALVKCPHTQRLREWPFDSIWRLQWWQWREAHGCSKNMPNFSAAVMLLSSWRRTAPWWTARRRYASNMQLFLSEHYMRSPTLNGATLLSIRTYFFKSRTLAMSSMPIVKASDYLLDRI